MNSRLIYGICGLALAFMPVAALAKDVKYKCADGSRLTASFTPPGDGFGTVDLVFSGSGDTYTLPQALSADGGRYADENTEFWTKGREAKLTRKGSSTTCQEE
ncbi:MliC family protein [Phyllobacterium pellucidum]|uniref:MliC family protein n=1 Tax=Phyllobacterium pellucidum TaxID=2740464 RepID=UPI001D14CCBB|nr:MliC family protein [Phyllobacterium sp. T1018]UGY10293.1 MliC family protein [Phyllobacterium sp. T1018]